jgi:hypothetical protein
MCVGDDLPFFLTLRVSAVKEILSASKFFFSVFSVFSVLESRPYVRNL